MPQHRITAPLHRSTPSWIRERDGRLRAVCSCGWRSPEMLFAMEAFDVFTDHIKQARAADAEISDPIPRNPDLPKLLRALATGANAQANSTAPILTAAADELDYWRDRSWVFGHE